MGRYFVEVAYKGTHYSGFQVQENAVSIQAEVEKALATLHRRPFQLTGSSRTDAGVHALQNFFHYDDPLPPHEQVLYKVNAILPRDIVVKNIVAVNEASHSRFHAVSREYHYHIYNKKNPFLDDRAYFFPYPLDMEKLQAAATLLRTHRNFQSFSKRNTQVKTFRCELFESEWIQGDDTLVYRVKGSRFLRGMVRGLVGTMLQVGRGKIGLEELNEIILSLDCTKADFSTPAHGLFLVSVAYPEGVFKNPQ
ncbi:MAG: tRNA pseudouridine(38-40) synthase TruA [Chitinophagaceae bacterium]